MTPDTIKREQDSCAQLVPVTPQAAALLYAHLFRLDPSLQRLFTGDMVVQGHKLMEMIGTAVGQLHELEHLVPFLQTLGKRHADYGVHEAHDGHVGAAHGERV